MAGHVFISYSRSDLSYVEQLAAYLDRAGIPVWYDYRLVVGDRFDDRIRQQIDECAVFVPVVSPSAVSSEWVSIELSYAHSRHKPIWPLMLERCDLPFRIHNLQYEDVTSRALPPPSFVEVLRELLASNGAGGADPRQAKSPPEAVAPTHPPAAEAGPGAEQPHGPRRKVVMTTVVLLAILLVGGGVTTGVILATGRATANGSTPTPTPSVLTSTSSPLGGYGGDPRLLLITPPSTSHAGDNPLSPDGKLTRKQVADNFTNGESVQGILAKDSWMAGAVVQWIDKDHTKVTIEISQFRTAPDASHWLEYSQSIYLSENLSGRDMIDQSPVPGIDNSHLYVDKAADADGDVLSTGMAAKGNMFMMVYVWQPTKQNKTAVVEIMQRQYVLLP